MTKKNNCKQYPVDQYGACAPKIAGTWEIYTSYIKKRKDQETLTSNVYAKNEVKQFDKIYFSILRQIPGVPEENVIGMLYPVGNCWEAKAVDDGDNGTETFRLTKIINGKVMKMTSTYTEAGYQSGENDQVPTIVVRNWYRVC